jgi:hypothetical protein
LTSQYGPALQYTKREIPMETWRTLYEAGYVETDFVATAGIYARKLIRRTEWQHDGGFRADDFYMTREMRQRLYDMGYSRKRIDGIAGNRADYKAAMEEKLQRLGIDGEMLMQPTVKWLIEAKEKVNRGEMTMTAYNHFVNRALPASLGTLGLHLPRRYKQIGQFLMTYQAMRLLLLSFFASIMDAGITVWRSGDLPMVISTVVETLRESKMQRAEKIGLLRELGAMSDGASAHVFNAAYVDGQYNATGINKWTEAFFRLNFMYQWTETLRYIAAQLSQKYMIKHAQMAKRGNKESAELLSHIGVTPEMVLDNIADMERGTLNLDPTSASSQPLRHAVNIYVDQSVMRPESGARPFWAGHPIGMIFWFLKGFMYQFQATVLQSIWNTAKRKGGGKIVPSVLQGIMAAAPMMAFTLPLTMLGYELRRQVGSLGDDEWFDEWDKRGPGGYMAEMIRRSGYFGVLEFPMMMDEDVERGNFFLSGVLGPTAEQAISGTFGGGIVDPNWWAGFPPGVPAVKVGREGLAEALGG